MWLSDTQDIIGLAGPSDPLQLLPGPVVMPTVGAFEGALGLKWASLVYGYKVP